MKEKNKKAEIKQEPIETNSMKSYETDPSLKDLASTLKDRCTNLRQQEDVQEDRNQFEKFENLYPSSKDISKLVNVIGDATDLQSDFKDSLNKIAVTFSQALVSLKDCEKVNNQVKELLVENFYQIARALAVAVEARDPYTGGHSERVFQVARELGHRCSLSPIEQMHLEGGSLLHDVGKIAIRDGVLLKPGPLTDSEYKEMQLHPIFGAQLVKKLDCLKGTIDAVLLHHERIDGYGYPYGLKGDEIPLIAKITSVVDAYDAMTTNRIYRKALSHEQAIEETIRNSGTQFDPEVVKVFTKWWEDAFQHNKGCAKNLYKHLVSH